MTFRQAVAELRAKHPGADMTPEATHGKAYDRALRLDFTKGRGGIYAGKDHDGVEVLVYHNDTEDRICCTEIDFDED